MRFCACLDGWAIWFSRFALALSCNGHFTKQAKIEGIYQHLRGHGDELRDVTVIRSKLAVTFVVGGFDPCCIVQVVLRIYKSPAEVLYGFDVDACCVAYDGQAVWAIPRARRALNGMVNVADCDRQSYTYEMRLLKYAYRGFTVVVPVRNMHQPTPVTLLPSDLTVVIDDNF